MLRERSFTCIQYHSKVGEVCGQGPGGGLDNGIQDEATWQLVIVLVRYFLRIMVEHMYSISIPLCKQDLILLSNSPIGFSGFKVSSIGV